ncbi:MAG: DUF1549 domain-containing protein, partial [Planctomycetaceae bacterium]|nr:DUF1549 domain-containing protein [Planctomycetaceae bacterium]
MNKSPQGNDKFICSSVDCPPAVRDEFFRLVNLHLDDTLSDIDSARLQTLMREHTVLVNTYVDLVVIHGQLTWGAAACTRRKVVTANDELSDHDVRSFRSIRDGLRRSTIRYATAVVLVLLPAVVGSLYFQQKQNSDGSKYPENHGTVVKSDGGESLRSRQTSSNKFTGDGPTSIPGGEHRFADPAVRDDHGMVAGAQSDALPPLKLNVLRGRNSVDIPEQTEVVSARAQNPPSRDSQFTRTDGQIVAHLNDLLEQSWADHGVSPSPPADDYEWIRRAYVTIAGRIPTSAEVRVFFDRSESRTTVIERL